MSFPCTFMVTLLLPLHIDISTLRTYISMHTTIFCLCREKMRDMTEIFRLFSKKKIAFFGEQFCSVEYSFKTHWEMCMHPTSIFFFTPLLFTRYFIVYRLKLLYHHSTHLHVYIMQLKGHQYLLVLRNLDNFLDKNFLQKNKEKTELFLCFFLRFTRIFLYVYVCVKYL